MDLPFNKNTKKEDPKEKEAPQSKLPGVEPPNKGEAAEKSEVPAEPKNTELETQENPEVPGNPDTPAEPEDPTAQQPEVQENPVAGEVLTEPGEVIPSTEDLQQQLSLARAGNQAILIAVDLGIDSKTIPYVIKLADFGTAVDAAGAVNPKALKAAIDKVLADIPALKPADQGTGFRQIGASDSQPTNQNDLLSAAFGNNKK